MFDISGETTAPCGVPTSVFDHSPSSDTPALSHFRMRRSILRSAMRYSINLTIHSCDKLSKKPRTSASSIQFIGFRDVGSLGSLRSIRSSMDSAMQVRQLLIQVRLVLLPGHAIYSGRSVPLQRVEAAPSAAWS